MTQLAKVQMGEFMNPTAFQQMETLSNKLIVSEALPKHIQNASQLLMVLLAGYEAGMGAMEAINSFYIVNGKCTIWGDAVLKQLRKGGWKVDWKNSTKETATVVISKGQEKYEETYTVQEARDAGLFGKAGIWEKYPKEMLRWKALGRNVRFNVPEVLGGFYLKEEMDGVTDVESEPAPPTTASQEEINRIIELVKEGGGKMEDLTKYIQKRYGCTLEQLTPDNAQKTIRALEKRLAEKRDKEEGDDGMPKHDDEQPEEVIDVETEEPKGDRIVDQVQWPKENTVTPDKPKTAPPEETRAAKAMREGKEQVAAEKRLRLPRQHLRYNVRLQSQNTNAVKKCYQKPI